MPTAETSTIPSRPVTARSRGSSRAARRRTPELTDEAEFNIVAPFWEGDEPEYHSVHFIHSIGIYNQVTQNTYPDFVGLVTPPEAVFVWYDDMHPDWPRSDTQMRLVLNAVKSGSAELWYEIDHQLTPLDHVPHHYRFWLNNHCPIRYGLMLDVLQGTDAVANQKRRRMVTKWALRETGDGFKARVFGGRPVAVRPSATLIGPGEVMLALVFSTLLAAGEGANLEDDDKWQHIRTNLDTTGPHMVEFIDVAQWAPHLAAMRAGTLFKIAKMGTRENGQIYYYPEDPPEAEKPTLNANHTRWANRIIDRDIERAPYPLPVWETVRNV